MAEKNHKDVSTKVDQIMDERQQLKSIARTYLHDKMIIENQKLFQKLEFLDTNQALMDDKALLAQKQNEDKYLERMNFFPFTNGDAIERQRKVIGQRQKEEINQENARREALLQMEKERKKEENINNKIK
jgi:hypothetical protein